MMLESPHRRTGALEKVSVSALSAEEQSRRVHDAVARRAFQISEIHKATEPQEVQDWLQAESELLHPFCAGRMPINGNLWLGTDANLFQEGTIEVWVAPHQVTICGKSRVSQKAISSGTISAPQSEMIYEVIALPEEVDPSRVTARVKSTSLEIVLGTVERKQETDQKFNVAA